jgi:PAS domain S-box-containing protein
VDTAHPSQNVDESQRWTGPNRCILWLALVLGLFSFYVFRADHLLANPTAEPYFDRDFLRLVRSGLFSATVLVAVLFVVAVVQRGRASASNWLVHAANQVWWVSMSLASYAFGPVTSPILGLLSLGGFVSIQLFPRRYVVPAMVSGGTILIASTVGVERGLFHYAPLFSGPVADRGEIASPFLVGTALASFTIIASSFALVMYLVERGRLRETDLIAAGSDLRAARTELEARIHERTVELSRANTLLTEEAAERRRAEEALRESETRLRAQFAELEHVYRNAPTGLCLQDTELRYVRVNEKMAAVNGQSVEAHIGKRFDEIVPDVDAELAAVMRRVIETDEPSLNNELHVATPGDPDTERHWLVSFYPVNAADGSTIGISSVVQDVSELKWAEERARRHLEELAHVSRLGTMGQMATGIAHELNQPLAAIANYAYVGLRKSESADVCTLEEIHKLFDELSTQALRAGGIVQHLRAFVNKDQLQRVTTSVDQLVNDVLELVGSELRANRVVPVVRLDDSLPMVLADTIQIQQVVLNLVRNAVEAMADENPTRRGLEISARLVGGAVEVAVRDTGAGLSVEDLDRVFDAFYTTKDAGMGMGLGISRSIVEDHGGRMWAEANRDYGMTFRFTLPQSDGLERADV